MSDGRYVLYEKSADSIAAQTNDPVEPPRLPPFTAPHKGVALRKGSDCDLRGAATDAGTATRCQ